VLRLLAGPSFGRIAITVGALPTILPISYRLVGDRIVFRTSPGHQARRGHREAVVAFEIDSIDPISHTGWSVVVTGVAREVVDPEDRALLEGAPIPRWTPSVGERVVARSTDIVSGRRVAPRWRLGR